MGHSDRPPEAPLGRCWCGGQVRQEFGYCGRWGLWCQYGHRADIAPPQTQVIGPVHPTTGSGNVTIN